MTTLWRTLPIDREADMDEPSKRELVLAMAIVEQALKDIRSSLRTYRNIKPGGDQLWAQSRTRAAEDAQDFLLRRLWEPGCWWGEVLRAFGARPLTERTLARAVRIVEDRGHKKGNGALYGKVSRTVAAIV